ncbi:hypothetical protein Rcae01_00191 [Novipirellula caenicola]|uniref:Uncharacterized protein n=1 Tax=Novipirellula caenicola TaxID=1536901 RepID=A0ABP9VHS1_9BACT
MVWGDCSNDLAQRAADATPFLWWVSSRREPSRVSRNVWLRGSFGLAELLALRNFWPARWFKKNTGVKKDSQKMLKIGVSVN